MSRTSTLAMSATALCWSMAAWPAFAQSEAEDFEKHVRPVLVEHCTACHGPKKQEAGLRLDSADSLRRGSDSGAVVTPGKPDDSPLIVAIRYAGDTKMPPKRKLPDGAIAALTDWVRRGAAWPVETTTPHSLTPREVAKTHWAFQPVRLPTLPEVQDAAWPTSPLDAFILSKLEQSGLTPSPRADRRTLIRRVTFDLHGLPPTPAEVADFEADASPEAFAKVVNRLLDSPQHGERWGRHWLDVARYADTKGYVRLKDNPNYPTAWTYRDYVIRAFNEDLPYDQFVVQQLAADRLDLGDDPRPLAALGFLTLGQRFINSQHDIIDDRIDVVTRGLLGLTASCARCHDHKFDPVPQRDYYSLHGVFASSLEPRVPPLLLRPGEEPRYKPYLKELRDRAEKLNAFLIDQQRQLEDSFRARAAEYLLTAQREAVQANYLATMFLVDASQDLNPVAIQRWGRLLERTRKTHDPVFAPWHALAHLPEDGFATQAASLIKSWREMPVAAEPFNALIVDALTLRPPRSLPEVAAEYSCLLTDADAKRNDPAWEELRQVLEGPDSPLRAPLDDLEEFLFVDATLQNKLHDQQRLVDDWIASAGAAPHAPAVQDAAVPVTPRVFLRGNSSNPGEAVPRQFLEVLSQADRQPFRSGSGRLELARAIADPRNPLTARVLVNRVWMHHFGSGLVRTPSDFGLRGEPPTHPELLDDLACRFVADGWSIKSLHRQIVLSSTYQQRSEDRPDGVQRDPENRLLWRMNRRRLDWEALRDTLLMTAGSLDPTPGGPSVSLTTQPFSTRRTVYGFVDRQNLPGEFRTFDFAPPDASSPQRHQTTVPQQALYFLNSPFLKEQARRLARRSDLPARDAAAARIAALHQLLYGREAEPDEIAAGVRYVSVSPPSDNSGNWFDPWEEYAQVLLLANEFSFVD
ncbi:MAG: PSD1 and planctomycete cytochrome C domain-containing protein [Planctomycetaceae bacterium]|nr:PSD1 and planctomycete cytochrome C domain-containing protein [Planctomycetaceae bacterium]